MSRLDEITAERKEIEQQNQSLKQRLNKQRQQLEDYLAEANRYADAMKEINKQITQNNDRFYQLGNEARELIKQNS